MNEFREFIREHRFFALIGLVIVVAFVMTSISLTLYVTSGASSLDLSRPGYVQARKQVKDDTVSKAFPSTGNLSPKDYELYTKLFDKQLQTIGGLGKYEPVPVNDVSLRLAEQAAQ